MSKRWENKGKEFDDIGNVLKNKEYFVIWGNPQIAYEVIDILEAMKETKNRIILVNNDIEWQKKGYREYEIRAISTLTKTEIEEGIFIIATQNFGVEREMKQYLKTLNVDKRVVFDCYEAIFKYLSVYFCYKYDLIFFASENIVPDTTCNLHCKDCLNFNEYIKEPIIDKIEMVFQDIDLFFKKVDKVYRLEVCGGEPFLLKNWCQIIDYIGKNYASQIIRLETVTNGTIIPSDKYCEVMQRNNVFVILDDYRENVPLAKMNYELVKEKLEKYGILYQENYVDQWIRIYTSEKEQIQKSEEELEVHYEKCGIEWSNLRNGKISSCGWEAYAEKAGIVKGYESDYFSLEGDYSKKELLEFRLRFNEKGYTNFCKICRGNIWVNKAEYPVAVQTF